MAVSYSGNRVTINGAFKDGVVGASTASDRLRRLSGPSFSTATDLGRLVAWVPDGSDASQTQVRQIVEVVSADSVRVNSPWHDPSTGLPAPPALGEWRIAHNCEDVHAIGNAALTKAGEATYRWNADWSVQGDGFFGDVDVALEMGRNGTGTMWPIGTGCIVQFGVLHGPEASVTAPGVQGSTETTGGCRIAFIKLSGSSTSIYSNTNSRAQDGAVVNYYGSLIESRNPSSGAWSFQRMRGPTRFIGSIFDGPFGGRFYHEASEWVDTRMSGNDNATPAWSLGATFSRPPTNVSFFQNAFVAKSYQSFTGDFVDCTFADSNGAIFNATGSGVIRFIDCTTFPSSAVSGSGGEQRQFKSVSYTLTDSAGAPVASGAVRINDAADRTQEAVRTSDASGTVERILTEFRRKDGNAEFDYGPFRIRIRRYGAQWSSLASAIADPIVQSVALRDDPNVTQAEAMALAHMGITVTDHGGSPVTWQGLQWGITVQVTSAISAADLKHALHAHLARAEAYQGKPSGLDWHNLIPMSGLATERGDYGGTLKGVRVVNASGDPFPGIERMESDDGTVYAAPVAATLALTGLQPGTEVRVYEGLTEIAGEESVDSGTFAYGYLYTADRVVDIAILSLGFLNQRIRGVTLSSVSQAIPVQQSVDRQYLNP